MTEAVRDSTAVVRLDVDAPIALWAVDLRIEPDPAHVALFDSTERARHQRFRFARDRRRYRAAHVALRRLLAKASGIAMPDQRFVTGDYGKPALAGQPALAFNMSYAGDVALIGIGQGRSIGVDAEVRRQIDDLAGLADSVFTDSERLGLMAEPAGALRDAAFLQGWTRKEACIKALGTGLSASLDFAVGVAAPPRVSTVFAEAGRTAIEVGSFRLGPMVIGAWAQRL
ncbi:4'-phosphopantetheinyl transferase superfamily protein [Sphingosinicellaceae bacterium]|nr:4'-phosphopantetheinyl transferase superfamily protein [Sphingosinicellaceae bacterium]